MHQKRLSAPKTVKIARKEKKWTVKTAPGPHDKGAVPLLVLVRDFLGLADTGREARKIISAGEIWVDGKPRKDYKFPIGLFDVVTIPKIEKNYRILFDERGRYTPKEVEDADRKIYKITGKTLVKGGRIQLNLFDGTNILASKEFSTKDSIVLKLPEREIIEHLKFEEGVLVMIIGGTHAGEIGRIKDYKIVRGSAPNLVTVEGEERDITTIEDYVFVVGGKDGKPVIDLGV
jgi:small subunit ribosomal protein S4e